MPSLKELFPQFNKRTLIMGVVNATPDSFSDGGLFFDKERAVRHAYELVRDGADMIDIGGESTRPGAEPVTLEEEIRRTVPVISEISKHIGVPVSIDACKAETARQALEAGASMINDISGLRFDPGMACIAARYGSPVIIMHIKGRPGDMQKSPVYEALIPEIMDYLREGVRIAVQAGISDDRILIDPGIGFGKTFDHNLFILKHLAEFAGLGKPIVVGVSRKAFIGKVLGDLPASERLEGTLAAVTAAVLNGADIVRVHDVKETVRAVKVADAIKRGCMEKTST
jgi:dihydropteroate synthase